MNDKEFELLSCAEIAKLYPPYEHTYIRIDEPRRTLAQMWVDANRRRAELLWHTEKSLMGRRNYAKAKTKLRQQEKEESWPEAAE